MDPAEISAAAVRANLGDQHSAQQIIGELLPYWNRAALSIALDPTDAEDLVQDALVQLLMFWQRGDGPTSNPRAYVTAMMRNNFASYKRSPRSRTIPTSEEVLDQLPSEHDLSAGVDFTDEANLVRKALDALSAEHRAVLEAIVVEGKKPRDLVDRLGRPAPAISALLLRAKRSLRRTLLVVHLQEGTEVCSENATRLPPTVAPSMREQRATDPGMGHILQCETCSSNWRKFGAAILAFGVMPLLVVAQPLFASAPASADDGLAELRSGPDQPAATSLRAAGRSNWYQGAHSILASKAFLVGGIVLSTALGAGALAVSIASNAGETDSRVRPDTNIETTVSPSASHQEGARPVLVAEQRLTPSGALAGFSFRFENLSDLRAKLTDFSLELPEGSRVLQAGNGLSCRTEASKVLCASSATTDLSSETRFDVETQVEHGEFRVQLQLTAGGQTYEGRINGNW